MKIVRFKKLILALFSLAFIFSLIFNFFLFFKYRKEKVLIIKPEAIIQNLTAEIPAKVEKLMRLPQDEQPQVFIITPDTPRNQPFVQDAKIGDALLLYFKNQKAILFDPAKNQIIKVGALTFTKIGEEQNKELQSTPEKSMGGRIIISPNYENDNKQILD